jgi:hypothetical protein
MKQRLTVLYIPFRSEQTACSVHILVILKAFTIRGFMHASTQTAERPVLYIYSMHKIAHHVETCPSKNCHSPPPRTRVVRELDVLKFRGTSSLLFRKYVFCEKTCQCLEPEKRVNCTFNHDLNEIP